MLLCIEIQLLMSLSSWKFLSKITKNPKKSAIAGILTRQRYNHEVLGEMVQHESRSGVRYR